MFGVRRMTPRSACLLPLFGTVMLLCGGLAPRMRDPSSSVQTVSAGMRAAHPTAHALERSQPLPPPCGEGTYRPGHFSVAPVIVAVKRSRSIARSRPGGLYGP